MKNLLKFNLGEKTIKKTVKSLGILSLFGGVGYCCYNTKFRNNYFNLLKESFCYLRYLKEFFNNKKILCQENYEDLYSDQTNNNSFYLNLGDNLYSTSTFYIVIDENNSSHADLVSKFLDTISKYNNSNISTNQINLKIISKPLNDNNNTDSTDDKLLLLKNNYNCLLINSSLNKVKNSNDPAIFVCNDNSFITSINPYSIINSSTSGSDLLANLTNMFNVKDYNSLRFHFRFLEEDPQRSIYIVKKSTIEDKYFKKHLSILHSMNSKVIVVNDSEIENQLELKDKIIYEYKSPKLPNKLKGVVLEKYLEIANERNNNNIHYDDSGENDTPEKNINDYLNNNPTSFLLKFNLFRNELIKIPEKNLTFNSIENDAKLIEILNRSYLKKAKHNEDNSNEQSINKDSEYINPELSRKRIINSFFYIKRNIVELAETDKNKIEKLLEEKNKHYLYIHLPSYSFIKEKIIDFVLYGNLLFKTFY